MTKLDGQTQAELVKARARIGDSAEKIIRWLLAFAQRDLSQLSFGDWRNLEYEMFEFVHHGVISPRADHGALVVTATSWRGSVANPTAPTRPTMDEITGFHQRVNGLLALILKKGAQSQSTAAHGRIYAQLTDVYIELRPQAQGRSWPLELQVSTEAIGSAWLFMAMQTVAPLAGLIRRCPLRECGVMFLADRSNQHYCSLQHQTTAATRKYRQKTSTGHPRGRPATKGTITQTKGGSHGTTRPKR